MLSGRHEWHYYARDNVCALVVDCEDVKGQQTPREVYMI